MPWSPASSAPGSSKASTTGRRWRSTAPGTWWPRWGTRWRRCSRARRSNRSRRWPCYGPVWSWTLLALVAASHSGERFHLDGVRRILAAAGLDPSALGNTADLPLDDEERLCWQLAGREASPLAQNCSGKHAGMLATCLVNGWSTASYLDPGHPLQASIAATVTELTGETPAAVGVDGCGAPVLAVSAVGLARAFARLATADPRSDEGRLAQAVRCYPEWLGGTGRDVTELVRGVPGLVAKDGAEGVYAAAMPDGRAAVVKIADGAPRARLVVLAAALRRLGVDAPVLDRLGTTPVLGHGVAVGAVQPVALG
jgi:L-asparaginase II